MGDVIFYVVLLGVVIFFILGINFFIGVIVFGLLFLIIIIYIKENSVIKGDIVIGIIFLFFLVLGIILIGFVNSIIDFFYIFFGNILVV